MNHTPRVIPVLTIIDEGVYRTLAFKKPSYVGDPINAIKIFNEKEVDEMVVLDITPNTQWSNERFEFFKTLASEAFMPMAYGGNITEVSQVEQILTSGGYEKVIINSQTLLKTSLIKDIAQQFGVQSVVASVDVGKTMMGKPCLVTHKGKKKHKVDLVSHIKWLEEQGAGEILIRDVECDGLMQGANLELIKQVSELVNVPVIATGGIGSKEHIRDAIQYGAHSVAAGSLFVYQGPRRAVLINYLEKEFITSLRK